MKIFFLLNPSKSKKMWDIRETAGQAARRQGCTPRFGEVDRSRPQSTDRLLDQAIEEGCRRVAVVGGDGTLCRVINSLYRRKRLNALDVAVVPAGTCNDFARALHLSPRRLVEALALACAGKSRETDLGRMTTESDPDGVIFLNNAGFGRRPSAIRPGHPPSPLATLRSFQATALDIRWDKGSFQGDFFMAMVCNAPYFSKGLHFSRTLRLNDGLLDISLVPVMRHWRLMSILFKAKLSGRVSARTILNLRLPRIDFSARTDLFPQADGEPSARAVRRVSFSVADQKAMIVTPQTSSALSLWTPE